MNKYTVTASGLLEGYMLVEDVEVANDTTFDAIVRDTFIHWWNRIVESERKTKHLAINDSIFFNSQGIIDIEPIDKKEKFKLCVTFPIETKLKPEDISKLFSEKADTFMIAEEIHFDDDYEEYELFCQLDVSIK